jgi:predicted phosphodiesterase
LHCDAVRFLSELPLEASIDDRLVAVHGALHAEGGRETVRLDSEERRRLTFEALVAHPSGARICAFGHTHQLGIFELRDNVVRTPSAEETPIRDDAYYLINPGTVGPAVSHWLSGDVSCRGLRAQARDGAPRRV